MCLGEKDFGSWLADQLEYFKAPPLSLGCHCGAKCGSIQGSFHVPVTLLEQWWGTAGAAHSSQAGESWRGPSLST